MNEFSQCNKTQYYLEMRVIMNSVVSSDLDSVNRLND